MTKPPYTPASSGFHYGQSHDMYPRQLPASTSSPMPTFTGSKADPPPNNSDISPIKVAYFDPPKTGTAGKLGMTLCPGRKGISPTGKYDRDLRKDMERLRNEEKCDILVCTIEDHEFTQQKINDYFKVAAELGIEVLWYPIVDGSTPKSMGKARKLIHEVVRQLRYGKNVVIHCKAGLGRTGTLAACTLVRLGYDAEDAITLTRATRHRTIEHVHQENFVRRFGGGRPIYTKGEAQPVYKGKELPSKWDDSWKKDSWKKKDDKKPTTQGSLFDHDDDDVPPYFADLLRGDGTGGPRLKDLATHGKVGKR